MNLATREATLTRRQRDVLRCVRTFHRRHGCAPTRREIAEHLGMSRPTAELHLQAIRDAGLIKLRTQWRGIFLVGGVQ